MSCIQNTGNLMHTTPIARPSDRRHVQHRSKVRLRSPPSIRRHERDFLALLLLVVGVVEKAMFAHWVRFLQTASLHMSHNVLLV